MAQSDNGGADRRVPPRTVAVTGSSGLVGRSVSAELARRGHRVIRLVRREAGAGERRWEPSRPAADLIDGVDAVVHLAGEPIAGRFTRAHATAIRESRVGPTARLAELAARAADQGRDVRFVVASAVGIYGPDRGDEILHEDSDRGEGLLADVVADWEDAASVAISAGVAVTQVRTGIVQSAHGGTLRLLRPLFRAGLGGRLGDGRQWTAWITIDDMAAIYAVAATDPSGVGASLLGPVNAVAPNPVRSADYAATLARVLRRRVLLPIPSLGPRLLLGAQGARELALAGQRAVPRRLLAAGYRFRFPVLEPALRHVLAR